MNEDVWNKLVINYIKTFRAMPSSNILLVHSHTINLESRICQWWQMSLKVIQDHLPRRFSTFAQSTHKESEDISLDNHSAWDASGMHCVMNAKPFTIFISYKMDWWMDGWPREAFFVSSKELPKGTDKGFVIMGWSWQNIVFVQE